MCGEMSSLPTFSNARPDVYVSSYHFDPVAGISISTCV
jgi:hypothetical protein